MIGQVLAQAALPLVPVIWEAVCHLVLLQIQSEREQVVLHMSRSEERDRETLAFYIGVSDITGL
jgi:hypothetical protein